METVFIHGDKVFDIRFGWGIVRYSNKPIRVDFNNRTSPQSYYDDEIFLLSFTEYILSGNSLVRPNITIKQRIHEAFNKNEKKPTLIIVPNKAILLKEMNCDDDIDLVEYYGLRVIISPSLKQDEVIII